MADGRDVGLTYKIPAPVLGDAADVAVAFSEFWLGNDDPDSDGAESYLLGHKARLDTLDLQINATAATVAGSSTAARVNASNFKFVKNASATTVIGLDLSLLTTTGTRNYKIPEAAIDASTFVFENIAQGLSNKAITGSTINSSTIGASSPSTAAFTTVTAGTWNGSVIAGQYGGTGVANTGKTITLGGNFTTSGAFTTNLTVTGNTNVTLPTTGTLARSDLTLAQFAVTTSLELKNLISDETGSGALVFGTSPTIATPTITGSATIAGFTSSGALTVTNAGAGNNIVMDTAGAISAESVTTDSFTVNDTFTMNGTLQYSEADILTGSKALTLSTDVEIEYINGTVYRSLEYILSFTSSTTPGNYYFARVAILHDGTSEFVVPYNEIFDGISTVSYTTLRAGSYFSFKINCSETGTLKFYRVGIKV